MKTAVKRVTVGSGATAALALLLTLSAPSVVHASGNCPVRIFAAAGLESAEIVTVLPFVIDTASPYPEDVMKKWKTDIVQLLVNRLEARGVSAASAEASKPMAAGLYLEGTFTKFKKGSAAGRILIGAPNAKAEMQLLVTLHRGDPTDPIAVFECQRAALGGPIGLGGFLAGNSKTIQHNNLEAFARNIAKTIANGGVTKRRKRSS